jgi:ubiquitin carboxyl-terminal hydrolase 5/13
VLGIGVEGGFEVDTTKPEYEEILSLVILPDYTTIPLPNEHLPEKIQQAIAAILASDSASRVEELTAWSADKDLSISPHALDLKQLDNGKIIPPQGWKCEVEGCDKTENLWLNLSDGTILCGRKNWDGSGGNGHALEHYKQTGFPLCVKLGTITAEGAGDVFSYAEDDMVQDPYLVDHLKHFGIDIAQMKKTEKTMAELELDLQYSFDWSRIQEQGKSHAPIYGPGYTGIQNLGNSCYMSSVMQVLFSLPEFQKRYYDMQEQIFQNAPADPTQDFHTQMAKLGGGLLSGAYSIPPKEDQQEDSDNVRSEGVRPRMFKALVGKGHPEFSTMRQQDALEFLQHLLTLAHQKERAAPGPLDPSAAFQFKIEERVQCSQSNKVKYSYRPDNILSLSIPLHKAINKEEVAAFETMQKAAEQKGQKLDKDVAVVRPIVPLAACLEDFAAAELVSDFYSTAIQAKTTALKTSRLATFPQYLVIHLRKYVIGDGWVPKKLDVFVQVPDELDLGGLRGTGLQEGEQLLPEESGVSAPSAAPVQADAGIVSQLVAMGFPEVRANKAAIKTGNSGAEAAMNWLLEHMDDPDIDQPLPASSSLSASSLNEAVETIAAMGFTRNQAIKALKATNNNVERAMDWIFSHVEELDSVGEESTSAQTQSNTVAIDTQPARYKLFAFISHIGGSTHTGHYVCHIKKDGKWIIYNDAKVAISEDTPKDMGYLYFYARV